jgi:hypothetical protein
MSVCDRGGRRRPSGRDTHVPRPAGNRCLLSAGRDLTYCPGRRPTLPATCQRRHSAPQAAARGLAVVAFEKRRCPRFSRRLTRYDNVSSSSRSGTATAASTAPGPGPRTTPVPGAAKGPVPAAVYGQVPQGGHPGSGTPITGVAADSGRGARQVLGWDGRPCAAAERRLVRRGTAEAAGRRSGHRDVNGPQDRVLITSRNGGSGLGTRHSSIRF